MRVAALADVHGNAPALAAVLDEVERAPRPHRLLRRSHLGLASAVRRSRSSARSRIPARFVRGNADRLVGSTRRAEGPWMAASTRLEDLAFLGGLRADRLGRRRRARPDLLLPRLATLGRGVRHRADSGRARVREFMDGRRGSSVVVTAHVHVQYDRTVDGVRLVGPRQRRASVRADGGARTGRFSGRMSSFAAPTTTSRRPSQLMRATDDPRVEMIVELMLNPPCRDEVIEDAERARLRGLIGSAQELIRTRAVFASLRTNPGEL